MKKTIPSLFFCLLYGLAACGGGSDGSGGEGDSSNLNPDNSSTSVAEELASLTWTEESQLPNDGGSASSIVGCNITRSSDGVVTVFYTIKLDGFGIYFARSADGGETWDGPHEFTPAGFGSYSPNVAIDSEDRLHVVWEGQAPKGIYYASSSDGGTSWTDAKLLQEEVGGNIISVDLNDRVHVTFHQGDPNSANDITEIYYTRSSDHGQTWDNPQLLSKNDQKHSAWARFDFSGTASDSLGIIWRDKRAGDTWDIYGAFSEDGGETWEEKVVRESSDKQWDPMSLVDADGRVHVSMMEMPKENQFEVEIRYAYSDDGGESYSTFQKMTYVRSRFPFLMYNAERNLIWFCWKDERDFNTGEANADIVGRYSLDGGDSWSELETAAGHPTAELRFHTFHLGTDGILRTVYSYFGPEDELERVYYRQRSQLLD